MTREEKEEFYKLLEEKERRKKFQKLFTYYPDSGPLRRELYQKHLAFFRLGKTLRERLLLGGNRTGKTEGTGGIEVTYHLTGRYPDWWEGRRFNGPTEWWAAGDTAKTTRDIIQSKLFGKPGELGTGLIPEDDIVSTTAKSGVPDAFDTTYIRHISGGLSQLQLKSYDQGRRAFEGTKKHGIWFDEECPLPIYTEGLLRTADTSGRDEESGIIIATFTPLLGLSEMVLQFLPGGKIEERIEASRGVVMVGWDDVPHLSEQTKKELLASIPPFQRDARSKGIPQLGSGAIWPIPEEDIAVDDFPIPEHWPRGYGMDVGWNKTAALWHALDRENDVVYAYSEHYRGQAEPSIHSDGIKARGEWIEGEIDPAARGRSQVDGQQLFDMYVNDCKLRLNLANNGVEAGLYKCWQRMSSGRYKVFKSCRNWFDEYRIYRRDEKGQVIRENDHLMVCSRYFVMSDFQHVKTKPFETEEKPEFQFISPDESGNWMG